MRAKIVCMAAAVTLLLAGTRAPAQELIPTPDPVGQARADFAARTRLPASNVPAAENWRYRWFNGRWWYWTPQNCWMWYSDDGCWMEYHPEVPVVVRPYGNVSVSVGRRIGVDVWGPHGDVRVGRIYVGW